MTKALIGTILTVSLGISPSTVSAQFTENQTNTNQFVLADEYGGYVTCRDPQGNLLWAVVVSLAFEDPDKRVALYEEYFGTRKKQTKYLMLQSQGIIRLESVTGEFSSFEINLHNEEIIGSDSRSGCAIRLWPHKLNSP
ncbi:hypothetical protein LCL97_11385 [Seohaeicola saemankumensis]|nr:hypothetical protein [Seohaeicola saemankumensis]MCA0871431.1 hypothetical protein [Seohaeicola saemankumensis]